ncbi:polyketide synthase [Fischerella sp. JS2]|uniref:polyketide synthase n=1 Tax=Fischerella sp. JS2 TaxID=2597771 RepID=UPI0028ED541D|nr:polyketide synthase [Fischerella sp. JS2]
MKPAIAIVGMACQYPDARSPIELWENVLAQRRAFRRIPSERLSLEDYWSDDRNAVDSTYTTQAALIEGYEFDRLHFRVAGNTFRSADFVHWLALDVATQALNDADFLNNKGLPHERTGVLVGNTLTGEFSRANTLRLRWPYVHRVVETTLAKADFSPQQRSAFLQELEATYKAPFPEITEETLAGNLSNTIAGRICNHYDLKGGGYTVDGACSSSLLAVANACTALIVGDLDVAIVGGIDLSLDPFELIGFAKTGALASDEMRVYDAGSNGFWPGEGCGFVVLMRYEDAVAQHHQVYAVIRGWGISSDGKGGITRPEVEGQTIGLNRAYERAGFDAATVAYFEGHGTGTKVGDATELQVLSQILQKAAIDTPLAVISSIKANIGHTKAAAGIAGLIKATMALHTQIWRCIIAV